MIPRFPSLRRYRQWLALLVLPALVFRALIPVGFMPLVDADWGITIGFCPGEAAQPGAVTGPHAHHGDHPGGNAAGGGGHDHLFAAHGAHHQHHGGGSEDPSTSGHHHAPCLFAASAGGAPAPAILTLEAATPEAVRIAYGNADETFLPTIIRAQSPRGPPAFS
jgi:hypothetical protein